MNSIRFLRLAAAGLLALIAVTHLATAGDEQWDSKLVPQGVTFTGKRADFPAGTLAMLEKQEASFGLCNDSQYLYVMLAFRNPMYARAIRRGGLTVWLDANGKKARDFMIKYTGGPTREQMMTLRKQGTEMQERQMPPEMRERMNEMEVDSAPVFLCYQKDRIAEKPIPVDGSEGPSAVFGVDQGFCVYEFKIPLKESAVRSYGMGVKLGQKISVGFFWGEFSQERGGSHMGFSGGMPGGGGMRPPDGMGEGPRGGGPGGEMRRGQMPQKQEVWVKAKLGVIAN